MYRKAFSLVELSIVLAILGLLVGGLMMGSNMIRNAEVQSIIADSTRYKDALLNFRSKYGSLPGDMIDATNYWGIRAGATGSNDVCYAASTPVGSTATCNGNGNGIIMAASAVYLDERYLFWQHLSNAGLIEGQYTGFGGTIAAELRQPGVNMPSGSLPRSFYYPFTYNPITGNPHYFDTALYSTGVFFGATPPALKPEEAWNIDLKIDDGRPGTGTVYSYKQSSIWTPNCATTDDPATAQYNVNNSANLCSLHFSVE